MRNGHHIIGLAGLLGSGVVLSAGCIDAVALYYTPLTDPALEDGGNPACMGDPTTDATIVSDACGVFVSASAAPGGKGTKEAPFATFAEAAMAKPARIFACAGTYTEAMQVSFSGGVEVYGGFTGCSPTSWTWSSSMQAQITTAPDVPGVVLTGGANKLENVSVTAPGATKTGGSSIAMLVNGGSLDMANGALTAGDAKDGATGTTVPDDPTLDGAQGNAGANVCDVGLHLGPMGNTKTCPTGDTSAAGNGGDGGQIVSNMVQAAGSGNDGSAMPPATVSPPNDGKGGTGEGQSGATQCVHGDDGASGGTGTSGGGATGAGAISATGYQGVSGAAGGNGKPGQGGGGGGGSEGGLALLCGTTAMPIPGAAGGAGGTGGCGGALGEGGQPGGASIALLVLNAQATLASVMLTAGKGGAGGLGGSGQTGGHGGGGGANGTGTGAAKDACPGGKGGQGGNGGPGGGGQGGHSLGIAFQGTTSPTGGTFMIDMTKNGKGGAGGSQNMTANMGQGADGMAANCWDFGKNAACM